MTFDFLLSALTLGTHQGETRRLDPYRLCEDPRGLSGTEVTVLGLAFALMHLGHHVRLFSYWTQLRTVRRGHKPGGVDFCDWGAALDLPDVAVAFHDSTPLTPYHGVLKVVWHQTLTPPYYARMAEEDVDLYISSTRVNAKHLQQYTTDTPWRVIPNGWDFGDYNLFPQPVPGRLFYHTSPERGLHLLLRALPLIQRRVPAAHVVAWCRMESAMGQPEVFEPVMRAMQSQDDFELHPHGGSRNEVLQSLATAQVLAYPSEPSVPCEVMPVSVMEALATGVPVVTAPSDGFEQAFGMALDVCPSPPSRYLEQFAERVVLMLRDDGRRSRFITRAYRWAKRHTFGRTAAAFLAVVQEALCVKC